MAGGKGFGRDVITTNILTHRVHQGSLFVVAELVTGLNTGDKAKFLIRVSPVINAFIRIRAAATDEAIGRFFEGPTVTDDGVPITAYSHNLVTNTSANTLFFVGPTITNDGVLKEVDLTADRLLGSSEWVLPVGDYLLEVENTGKNNQTVLAHMTFYEPPEGIPIV